MRWIITRMRSLVHKERKCVKLWSTPTITPPGNLPAKRTEFGKSRRTKNSRSDADTRRDARRRGIGSRDVSRARHGATNRRQRMGMVVTEGHRFHSSLCVCRDLPFLRHLRFLYSPVLGESARGGDSHN